MSSLETSPSVMSFSFYPLEYLQSSSFHFHMEKQGGNG